MPQIRTNMAIELKKIEFKKKDIKELTRDQLVAWLKYHGIESYRAGQIMEWIYIRQADTFDQMTNLGKEIRKMLDLHFTNNRLEKIQIENSQDGTRKYLFKLDDGQCVESVLIPEKKHYTLCISSQVGCSQGCRFCLTAKDGFVRNLTNKEIIDQIRDIKNDLDNSEQLTNLVLMGMGEPLANYKNVVKAIRIIADREAGLGFSNRKVTISTAGLVPKLFDLNRDTNVNLAISLNASDNQIRSLLMPINRKYSIEKLLEACRMYKLQPRRRITFEYVLIKGINDSEEDAERLSLLLKNIKTKINLIPFNSYKGSEFNRPKESKINLFQKILQKNNYPVTVRYSKGRDISAACGQLHFKAKPQSNQTL